MNPDKNPSTIVIGVGNLFRSDDSVGILVVRELKKYQKDNLTIMEHSGEGISLMDIFKNEKQIILVDAVSSKEKPGTIHLIDPHKQVLPKKMFSCSTHNFGVAEAVEMSRSLNQLPEQLLIFGIEGKNFHPGEDLSPEVEHAKKKVIQEIVKKTG